MSSIAALGCDAGLVVFLAPNIRISGDEFSAGVGGTVAATILMAETLAAHGWTVLVASMTDREVVFDGVRYAPISVVAGVHCDLLALVNSWSDIVRSIYARRRVFLYHDTRLGGWPDTLTCVNWADRTLVDSPFSVNQLAPVLSREGASQIGVNLLPIRLADYADAPFERQDRLLYSSMPDRGLIYLARWFPAIKSQVPTAELHITGDFTMYGRSGATAEFKRFFSNTPGVVYHGHVTRPELVELQKTTKVLAFPCTFPEGFCIAAAEAMAAGVVPVTSDAFALTTTVGSAGVLIPGNPGGGRRRMVQRWIYGKRFVSSVVKLLVDPLHRRIKSDACRSAAGRFHPDEWYKLFIAALN